MTENITAAQLRAYVERVEALESERQDIAENIKEVFAEAKANGFDAKIMRQVIKLRAMDASDRAEQESLLDLYTRALGMKAAAAEAMPGYVWLDPSARAQGMNGEKE